MFGARRQVYESLTNPHHRCIRFPELTEAKTNRTRTERRRLVAIILVIHDQGEKLFRQQQKNGCRFYG